MPSTRELRVITLRSSQRQAGKRNWSLIVFRWIVCLIFVFAFLTHLKDVKVYYSIIARYINVPGCDFVQFQISVLITCLIMLPVLVMGPILLLTQHIRMLRSYMPFLFVGTWLHFLIILVSTQTYPLVHDVHAKWTKGESISSYEAKYKCCGVLGPDDYLAKYGALPSSCFKDSDRTKGVLYTKGCLKVNSVKARLVRIDLVSTILGFALLLLVLGFYFYLIKINATKRNCTQLRQAYIFL